MRLLVFALSLVCIVIATPGSAAAREPDRYEPTPESLKRHPLPHWWNDGKFGIFIHWGPYSVPAFGAPPPAEPVLGQVVPPYIPAEWYWFGQQVPGSEQWRNHLEIYGPDLVYDDFIPQFTASRFDPPDVECPF